VRGQATRMERQSGNADRRVFVLVDFVDRFSATYSAIARRAYEIPERNGKPFGQDRDHWLKAEAELLHPVRFDLVESSSSFVIHAELPGCKANEVSRMEPPDHSR